MSVFSRSLCMVLVLALTCTAVGQGLCSLGSRRCGDCDGNAAIDVLDAFLAARHAVMMITLSPQAFSACNVTGVLEPAPGAVVDILDALAIAQYSIGLGTLTCCGGTPPTCTILAPAGGVESGGVVVRFDSVDAQSNPVDITFEYDAGGGFVAATALGASPLPSPALAVAPAAGLELWWDTLRDLPSQNGPVTFRITVDDLVSGSSQCTTMFDVDNLGCVPDAVLTGMTTPFTVDGDTRVGGDSADLGCGLWCLTHGRADADNVLEYTIPTTGDYTFALCNPNPSFVAPMTDTRLEVRVDSCTMPTATSCNDDSCAFLSRVTMPGLMAGTVVYIAVEAYLCSHGQYTLEVTSVP